ncbi:MAG: hypothetical protein IJ242_05235 [Clostridia bacterium]|nr:hypothetical protein [Clostridia bacterium]
MKQLSILLVLLLLVSSLPVFAMAEYGPFLPLSSVPGVDIDLSQMSGTVVYAQVYNILMDPQAYLGKTIRMSGYYDIYEDSVNNAVYFSCIIPDATACCAQGIEFIWAGDHTYPDDYPEPGTDVIVTGRLESYTEGGYDYLHLVDSDVVFLTSELD